MKKIPLFVLAYICLICFLVACKAQTPPAQYSEKELSIPDKLTEGIWVIGVLPDNRMIDYVKESANREIMQTVLRYEYDGKELSVCKNVYFQGSFESFLKGGDLNLYIDQNNEIREFPNPTEMIDTDLLKDAWKDNEAFRLVYYRIDGLHYFLAVSDKQIIILSKLENPNNKLPLSADEVTSNKMLKEFTTVFSDLKGESLVNILEPLVEAQASTARPNAGPPTIMVDDILYYSTGNKILVEIDESEFLGRITSNVSISQMPTENGQANIPFDDAPYAKHENGIVVMMNKEWTLFEARDRSSSEPSSSPSSYSSSTAQNSSKSSQAASGEYPSSSTPAKADDPATADSSENVVAAPSSQSSKAVSNDDNYEQLREAVSKFMAEQYGDYKILDLNVGGNTRYSHIDIELQDGVDFETITEIARNLSYKFGGEKEYIQSYVDTIQVISGEDGICLVID